MNIATAYSFCKSLHLIGMVSWMAGMFYLVRIMVNHAMAFAEPEPARSVLTKQYTAMEWKSYRLILVPAIVITWSFGVTLLCLQPAWMQDGWMHVKLTLLVLLTGYSHYLKRHIKQLEAGTSTFTHVHYRALNEVPTVFLVAIVFLAVFKNETNYTILSGGVLGFMALIGYGVWKTAQKIKK